MTRIDSLPEELVQHVFSFVRDEPPSFSDAQEEPKSELTQSARQDLKNLSLTCRDWRRVVLPLLFRHARFRLAGSASRPTTCTACSADSIQEHVRARRPFTRQVNNVDRYHIDMINDAINNLIKTMDEDGESPHVLADNDTMTNIITWIPRFYHDLCSFLEFVKKYHLASKIETFTLLSEKMLPEKLDRYPHRAARRRDWRYRAVAAFWPHLLGSINPRKVSILAPPVDLACLTLSAMDTFGDWAFGDMDYHLLILEHESTDASSPPEPINYLSLSYMPLSYPGVARSSLLNLREWTSVHLNEGSFLKAYGTYEYFERGPPTVIHSINPYLSQQLLVTRPALTMAFGLNSLRKLTYTAIFPFANHLDFHDLLHQLEELDLQLAPSVRSRILSNKDRVGKAELMDCWGELSQIYQAIASRLATFRITTADTPHLKKFICRDYHVAGLRAELDEIFTVLCLPVWAECSPGVFTRLAPAGHQAMVSHWEEAEM